jgi:hypothetical protein
MTATDQTPTFFIFGLSSDIGREMAPWFAGVDLKVVRGISDK